ncbi:hypothetical protein IWQ61_000433 [Dispira simplex]|nr:hypothetical protein IWQ61_000433 [Dispira simplex]
MWSLVVLILSLGQLVDSFYVPSVGPQYFTQGQSVPLYVNKVNSGQTPLPYAYYDLGFVCRPDQLKWVWLNLGEVLRGDRIAESNYQLIAGENRTCEVLCTKVIQPNDALQAKQLIEKNYQAEWIVDNLPGATTYRVRDHSVKKYEPGFPLGFYNKFTDVAYLHNHVALHILYEPVPDAQYPGALSRMLMVGFEVYPLSIQNNQVGCPNLTVENPPRQPIGNVANREIAVTYTYSVSWIQDTTVSWRNRWDRYLSMGYTSVHWYSIINSVFVSILLAGIVAVIMLRVLNRDLAMYSEEDLREDQLETIGWKLLHGDVFRPPSLGGLLAPLLGNGMQLLFMAGTTTLLAALGILSPSYRGGLLSVALALYVLMGITSGYWSARMYKVWRGTAWLKNALITGFLAPGIFFVAVAGVNLFIWSSNSSSAIPFGTFFALSATWFGISVPLVVLGAFLGNRQKVFSHPVRTNQIPRQIPPQPWYLWAPISLFITGAVPFGVIFVEMFFMLKSIWQDKYYYMFGFMVLVGLILIITVIEITVVIIYFQLCSENHRWWWRSFIFGGSSAIFIFLYSMFYFFTRLNVTHFVPALAFTVYSLLAALAYFLCFGSVAFFSTYWFVRKIFQAVKLD